MYCHSDEKWTYMGLIHISRVFYLYCRGSDPGCKKPGGPGCAYGIKNPVCSLKSPWILSCSYLSCERHGCCSKPVIHFWCKHWVWFPNVWLGKWPLLSTGLKTLSPGVRPHGPDAESPSIHPPEFTWEWFQDSPPRVQKLRSLVSKTRDCIIPRTDGKVTASSHALHIISRWCGTIVMPL